MITYKKYKNSAKEKKFSVLIPTWNNLDMLKLSVKSIHKNSFYEHQIILHINENADGALDWALKEEIDHTFSQKNVGVCLGMNAAASLAETDYIVYLNDDMYLLPDWDRYLMEEIENIGHKWFFLSATTIEPRKVKSNRCNIAPYDYGRDVDNFEEQRLLEEFESLEKPDWNGATWPPNIVHRSLWELVGGYSIEFSPGMYSDPDFSMKLWQIGVRYFKGVSKSRAYHFLSRSTGRVKKNDGSRQFLHKWGITNSTFGKYYIKRGTKFNGPLTEPKEDLNLKAARTRARVKKILNLS